MPGPCPTPERFAAALRSRQPGGGDAELAAHLADCPACQAQLETLAGGSGWLEAKAKAHTASAPAKPQPLMQAIQELESRGGSLHDEQPQPPKLDFLQSSDQPGVLGRFGPYEVIAHVASGGMGIVLKARDPALDRIVALKILSPTLAANALARARFVREARAAAAVVHEHVVPIYAVDESAGLPYLVMQFVKGRTLAERIRATGPLRLEEILRIGAQTAAGLAAAHAQGLIHRDVKPGNILLENSVERVKLTDFGLARAADDTGLTRTGELAGTPEFMAPEQAGNEAVDHRSDLFSFGSVLYAMCTGHSPFQASSVIAAVRKVCEARPPPVHEVNPAIPRWFSDIVACLMAKVPDDRFQSAREVGGLLERHLAHVQHGEPGDPREISRPRGTATRLPQRVLIGAAVGLALMALLRFALNNRHNVISNIPAATSLYGPITNPANGHIYHLLSQNTWTASEREATHLGGHLVTINDQAEQDWVFSTFGNYGGTPRCLWIGFRRPVPHAAFQWAGDTNSTYSNWAFDEPTDGIARDGTGGATPETFVHMWDGTHLEPVRAPGKWNDLADLSGLFGKPLCGVVEIEPARAEIRPIDAARRMMQENSFVVFNEVGGSIGGFASLKDALAAAPAGALIELCWNGSRNIGAVTLPSKPLTLRAGRGFQPVWSSLNSTSALSASAALTLEGIRFDMISRAPRTPLGFAGPRRPRTPPSGIALLSITHGPLRIAHCTFEAKPGIAAPEQTGIFLADVHACHIEDTLLFAPTAKAIVWQQSSGGNASAAQLTVTNCIANAMEVFWLDLRESPRARLEIARSTFHGMTTFCVPASLAATNLEVDARQNVFHTGSVILDARSPASPPLPQWLRWREQENLHKPREGPEQRYTAGTAVPDGPARLEDWNRWWNQTGANSRVVQLTFASGMSDLKPGPGVFTSERDGYRITDLGVVEGPGMERDQWSRFGADTANVGPARAR